MIKVTLLLIIATLASLAQTASPLGLPTTISDLYIPGSKAEVIPRKDSESSLVIRIIETKPAAEGFRYDLEVYGLDPGTHQISTFLRYADTKEAVSGVDHTLEVTTRHPLDTLPRPVDPEPAPPKKVGGYQTLIIVLGIIWFLVFLVILFYRKKQVAEFIAENPPPTLHEKLQVLVSAASRGELTDHERANLERLILGHWRGKIAGLESLPPAKALVELRRNQEASPLVLKLEEWLHAPNPTSSQDEILPLLEPYRES